MFFLFTFFIIRLILFKGKQKKKKTVEGISQIITFEILKMVFFLIFLFVFFSSRILYRGFNQFNILSKVSRKINNFEFQWCQKLMKNINNHKINIETHWLQMTTQQNLFNLDLHQCIIMRKTLTQFTTKQNNHFAVIFQCFS